MQILVAEIGSTTTVVNAFAHVNCPNPVFLGQGQAPTTVGAGDVALGLEAAIADLKERVGPLSWSEMYACSSAAGGLKMTVHGLVYDMTVKAAREAALGAGAIIRLVTAGELGARDLTQIKEINPNIILLAGGVDYGEKNTIIANARHLAALKLSVPVVFAGNTAAWEEVQEILAKEQIPCLKVDNVYPRIDQLQVEPARRAIQALFEKNIVKAPGMAGIRKLVTSPILPTPGAVMETARLLQETMGDLVLIDVGGATTDVHSVTEGSEEIQRLLLSPEPFAKRTVEGDLGVYVNVSHVAALLDPQAVKESFGCTIAELLEKKEPIPASRQDREFTSLLTETAVQTAMKRHAGSITYLYGPTGRVTVAQGKDLTKVKWIIGTGGALTRLPGGEEILTRVRQEPGSRDLLPSTDAQVLLDHDYIIAACGVLAQRHPQAALKLIQTSLKYHPEGN
ncbi:MAG TPA: DNA mismatch repair protein MutL [Firmicutes bacterium]|nr:DNA mismatch repair protein MutL [Bacillota bacterium]